MRCCCEPNCPSKNTVEQLRVCLKRVDTMVFHLGHNMVEVSDAEAWLDDFGFSDEDKAKMVCQYKAEDAEDKPCNEEVCLHNYVFV